jgi:hypothetical protein
MPNGERFDGGFSSDDMQSELCKRPVLKKINTSGLEGISVLLPE